MRTVDSVNDILNITDEGILNNNRNGHYILFMKMVHNFVVESGEIHFDYHLDLLNKTNYILTRLYETCNEGMKKDYYEMTELILNNLERKHDDKNKSKE